MAPPLSGRTTANFRSHYYPVTDPKPAHPALNARLAGYWRPSPGLSVRQDGFRRWPCVIQVYWYFMFVCVVLIAGLAGRRLRSSFLLRLHPPSTTRKQTRRSHTRAIASGQPDRERRANLMTHISTARWPYTSPEFITYDKQTGICASNEATSEIE